MYRVEVLLKKVGERSLDEASRFFSPLSRYQFQALLDLETYLERINATSVPPIIHWRCYGKIMIIEGKSERSRAYGWKRRQRRPSYL